MDDSTEGVVADVLTFVLAEGMYGIDVAHIKEVLGLPRITRVPRMPDYMNGVINLRGNVVPVLDLKMKFGFGSTEPSKETSVIVTEVVDEEDGGKYTIGIFADEVLEVVSLDGGLILPPPKIGVAIDTEFIRGMGKIGSDFVILLGIDRLLSVAELTRIEPIAMEATNG